MLYSQKRNLLKNILIISFLLSIIPMTFINLILRDFSFLNTFFNNYFKAGKSLFLPFLPCSNIIWFLPEETQIIQFSTGHLIDIIFIINIIAIVDRSCYHYYIRVCLSENYIEFYLSESKEELYTTSQEYVVFFGVKEESSYTYENKLINIKFKKKSRLNERCNNCYVYLRKKNNSNNLIQNNILLRTSFTKHYKNFQVFCFHSVFEKFFYNLSNFHLLYPQLKTTINSINFFKQEG